MQKATISILTNEVLHEGSQSDYILLATNEDIQAKTLGIQMCTQIYVQFCTKR